MFYYLLSWEKFRGGVVTNEVKKKGRCYAEKGNT